MPRREPRTCLRLRHAARMSSSGLPCQWTDVSCRQEVEATFPDRHRKIAGPVQHGSALKLSTSFGAFKGPDPSQGHT